MFRGGSPRRVALFLDEYHVSPGSSAERTRVAIARFVERHLRADDAVIVMKPLGPSGGDRIDPSAALAAESALNDAWRSMSTQTGGVLFPAGSELNAALARVAADLEAHYVVEFEGAEREDAASTTSIRFNEIRKLR